MHIYAFYDDFRAHHVPSAVGPISETAPLIWMCDITQENLLNGLIGSTFLSRRGAIIPLIKTRFHLWHQCLALISSLSNMTARYSSSGNTLAGWDWHQLASILINSKAVLYNLSQKSNPFLSLFFSSLVCIHIDYLRTDWYLRYLRTDWYLRYRCFISYSFRYSLFATRYYSPSFHAYQVAFI